MYVLAIDDDPDTLKLLAFVLHDAGYQFTSASDWASCIGAIEQVRPGLVLLEAQLRSGSGFELCRRLRGLSDVPLIFLAQLAFIVAFGVLLDTLIVRSLLVPALAVDIGPKIWWPAKSS